MPPCGSCTSRNGADAKLFKPPISISKGRMSGAFKSLDLRLQLCLREIVFVLGRIHQKAAHEQGDVRLALVGFQQIAVEMLPGGFEFASDGFTL